MTLAEKVSYHRKRLGLSIRDLAEISDIDISCLSRIENGKTQKPWRETLVRLSEALGIPVEDLGEGLSKQERAGYVPRFAFCRRATGHSQKDAARRLGLRVPTLAGYESCQAFPPAWIIPKMAALYGVTCDYLLGVSPDRYRGRFCTISYCEAGEPHDHCCADCPERSGCAEACENNPERCGCCRTKRPHEMFGGRHDKGNSDQVYQSG